MSLDQVLQLGDVAELLEQHVGSANPIMRLFLLSRSCRVSNPAVYASIRTSWHQLEQCIQWLIDRHVMQLAAEAAVRRRSQRFWYEDDSD